MSYDTLFSILNLSVLPAWLLLIALPRADITRALVHSGVYPVLLGAFYVAMFAVALTTGDATGEAPNFTSIKGIQAIFATPQGVLIGWSHYLVFDLFVGAWQARDAQRRGVPHALLIPCLVFTFLLGPVGLLLYLLLRLALKRSFTLDETPA